MINYYQLKEKRYQSYFRVAHIIPVRSASSRFPNKIFHKLDDENTMLDYHLGNSFISNDIIRVVAVPKDEKNVNKITEIAEKHHCIVMQPDCEPDNILDRFISVAYDLNPDWIIRTTQDCPYMVKDWVTRTLNTAISNNVPVFNSYDEGSTLEVFRFRDLLMNKLLCMSGAYDEETKKLNELHVTWSIRKGVWGKGSIDTERNMKLYNNYTKLDKEESKSENHY